MAEQHTAELIRQSLENGTFVKLESIRPNVLKKMQDGAKKSPLFPGHLRKFFAHF